MLVLSVLSTLTTRVCLVKIRCLTYHFLIIVYLVNIIECHLLQAYTRHLECYKTFILIWGQWSKPIFGGNKYFLSIIDDFSRLVWVFLLKDKIEDFLNFRNWKVKVENQIGKKVKYLHTDNGLEFCNTEFDYLCNEYGIARHKTIPYTHK